MSHELNLFSLVCRQVLDSLTLDNKKSDSIIFGKFIEELRNH